jgi:hypothetical protein
MPTKVVSGWPSQSSAQRSVVLCCAALRCAALCCAVLCCAVLCCAVPTDLFGKLLYFAFSTQQLLVCVNRVLTQLVVLLQ